MSARNLGMVYCSGSSENLLSRYRCDTSGLVSLCEPKPVRYGREGDRAKGAKRRLRNSKVL